ncbi:MAG TPA: hypothetical protein PK544_09095 [Spirochaetota bacterium]|nr:hypothetical protein [Spirochaetota bacterium]HPJ37332.1 hypothetical protein [Spirochaetota bacterium]
MKTRFIKVDDISQIDLSKVSVYDLRNRYIDAKGNMYGLKYNRNEKKIEIIKIIRTLARGSGYYSQQIMKRRENGTPADSDEEMEEVMDGEIDSPETAAPEPGGNESESPADMSGEMAAAPEAAAEDEWNPDYFISKTITLMESHKSRLNGIVMNVKNSNIVPANDKMGSTFLIDVFRNIDLDGVQKIDTLQNSHKELVSYPRSIVYYVAKLDTRSKNIVDTLDTDSRKMRFIYLSEMYFSIRNLYRSLKTILNELKDFIGEYEEKHAAKISYNEEKILQDGKTSISNTISEINMILTGCKKLENFVYNEGNF